MTDIGSYRRPNTLKIGDLDLNLVIVDVTFRCYMKVTNIINNSITTRTIKKYRHHLLLFF